MPRLGKLAATRIRSERGQPVEPSPTGMSYADPATGQWYALNQADLEQAEPAQTLDERLMARQLPGAREPRGVFTDPETGEKRYVVGTASGGMDVTEGTPPEALAQYEAKALTQSANMRAARAERQRQAQEARQRRIDYYRRNFPQWYASTQQAQQPQQQQSAQVPQGATQESAGSEAPTQAQQEQQARSDAQAQQPSMAQGALNWVNQNVVNPVMNWMSRGTAQQDPQQAPQQPPATTPTGGHAAGGYQGRAVGLNLPQVTGNLKRGSAMKATAAILKQAMDSNNNPADGYTPSGVTRNVGQNAPGSGYSVQQEKPESELGSSSTAIGRGLMRSSRQQTPPVGTSGVGHSDEGSKTAQAIGERLFSRSRITPKSVLRKALRDLRPRESK